MLLSQLAIRNIGLYAAITPSNIGSCRTIVGATKTAGVRIGLWPMISNELGRWASAWTAYPYIDFVDDMLKPLARERLLPDELLIDLEPPINAARAAVGGRWMGIGQPPIKGWNTLRSYFATLNNRGLELAAAIAPWCVSGRAARAWQWAMGTPIDGQPFARIFAMAYTSMIEGYSRGLLGRKDSRALLSKWTTEIERRHGTRGAIALGVTGRGALGDEPTYRHADELSDDAQLAKCSNRSLSLALFDLSGALARPPLHSWLDALQTDTASKDACPPYSASDNAPMTIRSRMASAGFFLAGHWLGRKCPRSAR